MNVGQLRAALEDVRDDAVLIGETASLDFELSMQFEVLDVLPIGGRTEDPGLVLQLRRRR